MNCFDWQNHASEYLDGALIGALKEKAETHLGKCDGCNKKLKHYRMILTSISGQPRKALPEAIRKAPLSTNGSSSRTQKIHIVERMRMWSEVPAYIRVPMEGAAIVLAVTLAISGGPRLRALYERKLERSLTEYSEGFANSEAEIAASSKIARGNVAAEAPTVTSGGDDFSEGESGSDSADDTEEAPAPRVAKAGASETWRFNLKTDSPIEVRSKIVEILGRLKIPPSTPGATGVEAPGGIQFDMIVPQEVVPELKAALEKIAPAPIKDLADSPMGETFTWYKKKSRNPIPAGQTQVIIWLAQI